MRDLKWGSVKWFIINIVIACVYLGAGQMSDTLSTLNSEASPIWAPSGIVVAAVLIFGYKVFPGIFSGAVAINVLYFQKQQPARSYLPASIAFGLFSVVEAFSCSWLLKHPLYYKDGCFHWKDARDGTLTVDTLHDALWLFIVAPITTLIAGTGNAIVLSVSRLSTWSHFMVIWPTWVLGDLSAILCYLPCILHLWNLFHEDFKTFCWGRSKSCKVCFASHRNACAFLGTSQARCHANNNSCVLDLRPTGGLLHVNGSVRSYCKPAISSSVSWAGNPGRDIYKPDKQGSAVHIQILGEESRSNLAERQRSPLFVSVNSLICSCCRKCNSGVLQKQSSVIRSQNNSSCRGWNRESERDGQIQPGDFDKADMFVADTHSKGVDGSATFCEAPVFSIHKFLIRAAECVVLFVILISLSLFIFFNVGAPTNGFAQRLSYLVFPVVIWASFRFNRVGLPLSVVVVAVVASGGTAKHHGLLNNDNSLLQVQMFVSVLAMVAITLAAIVHDRKQMEGELNEMNITLESQVQARTKELERANRELQVSQAAAEEASKAKSEFLANMSHEIRLVGMMGGRIWLESESGQGSTFFFIAHFDKGDPSTYNNEALGNLLQTSVNKFGEVYLNHPSTSQTISPNSRNSEAEKMADTSVKPIGCDHSNGLVNDEHRRLVHAKQVYIDSKGEDDALRLKDIASQECSICKENGKVSSTVVLSCEKVSLPENQHLLFQGMKVLLAEDNLVNQKVACQQLKKFGTEVDVVSDGQQCLNALQMSQDKYDLILMDVQMPVLDGLQATKMIRANEKQFGLPRRPIIGLTAHAIQGYKDKCLEAGMDAYACKPFQAKQLFEVIQTVLDQ